jgi:hypothetical protein
MDAHDLFYVKKQKGTISHGHIDTTFKKGRVEACPTSSGCRLAGYIQGNPFS